MATIDTRRGRDGSVTYRARVRLLGRPPITQTFTRRTDARTWAAQIESDLRRGRQAPLAEAMRRTLAQLVGRYLEETLPTKGRKTEKNFRAYLDWWKAELGDYTLANITPALISERRRKLHSAPARYGRDRGPASVNRYLAALSTMFTTAVKEYGWCEFNPCSSVAKMKEPKGRVRFLSDEERRYLLEACSEAVAIGRLIEAQERKGAEERIREGGRLGAKITNKIKDNSLPAKLAGSAIARPKVNDQAAKAVGMGKESYRQAKAVIKAAETAPERFGDLYAIVLLALSTGARQGEILGMRWADVDLTRAAITLHDTKNGDRRALPLAGPALDIMRARSKVRRLGDDRVFPHPTKKDKQLDISAAWYGALAAARAKYKMDCEKARREPAPGFLGNFRFHDLRHSAASYLAMNGATLAEIAGILGHRTLAMVKRYAHLSDQHVSKVVARMNAAVFGGDQ